MPAVGERKVKNGVTGEWDGTTWRRVDAAASDAPAGPKVGERKTKDGVTGEWDGTTWRRVAAPGADPTSDTQDAPANWMGGVSALAAGGAAALPAARGLAERIATSPMLSRAGAAAEGVMGKLPGLQHLGPLNAGKQAYDVLTGRQSIPGAVGDYARNAILSSPGRAISAVQNVAGRVATGLGAEGVAGMAAPIAVPIAGGLAGVAGTAGFLGALQHDANRHVDIDYTKNTPDTDIAKVLMNMRNSEANRGRTVDERMDDPNDVMFRPDDTEMVRAAVLSQLQGR